MFDSNWLDIAIGITFVWFVFALFVTLINETLTRLLALRSKQMWQGLYQLLDGTAKPKSLLRSAFKLPFFHDRPDNPSKRDSNTEKLYATATIQGMENRTDPSKKTRVSNIPAQLFSQALIEFGIGEPNAQGSVKKFVESLDSNSTLGRQLKAIWATVNDDVQQFRAGVEGWFDGQMARLSAAYKARVRYFLIPIGIIVAFVGLGFGLRTDAIALLSDVQHDQNFRSLLVGAATDATREDLAKIGCQDKTLENESVKTRTECELKGVSKLSNIDLIIRTDTANPNADFWDRIGLLKHVRVFIGVLVTGLAISFGSTFWFDVVKRLLGMRKATPTAGS